MSQCQIHGTWLLRSKHRTMPVYAKERLWTGVCLRQTLLRLEPVFDTCEVGTSRLLAVPLTQFTPLCRARLSRCLLLRSCGLLWPGSWRSEDDPTRSDLVVSSMLHYEHNVQVWAPSAVVHRPNSCCVHWKRRRECAACTHFVMRRKWCCFCANHSRSHVNCVRDDKYLCLCSATNFRARAL